MTKTVELIEQLEVAKKNVIWLLNHPDGLVDMHGLASWAQVVESLRNQIKSAI